MANYQNENRKANLKHVLRLLFERGPLSRIELAGLMGLNKVTVSSLISDLSKARLVTEADVLPARGVGRPARPVALDSSHHVALAAEVAVGTITVQVVGVNGRPVFSRAVAMKMQGDSLLPMVGKFLDTLGRVAREARERGLNIVGAAVGVAGLLNQEGAAVVSAPYLGWEGIALREKVERVLGPTPYGVHLSRLSTLAAFGEYHYGNFRGTNDFVLLYGTLGIGGAAFLNGRSLLGRHNGNMDVGHIPIDPSGPMCPCGRRGCLQVMAGAAAVLPSLRDASDDSLRIMRNLSEELGKFVARVQAGDKNRRKLADRQGLWLARGVSTLIQILGPELLILGGYFNVLEPVLRNAFELELQARLPQNPCRVVMSTLGDRAPLLGAGAQVFDRVFQAPEGLIS